jgi:hypothetical protein
VKGSNENSKEQWPIIGLLRYVIDVHSERHICACGGGVFYDALNISTI